MSDTINANSIILNYAYENKKTTESQIIEAIFEGHHRSIKIIDKFSTWLLAGTAAAASLTILNIDKLFSVIDSGKLKLAITALLLSAFFGIISKYLATSTQSLLVIEAKIKKLLTPVIENYEIKKNEVFEAAKNRKLEINSHINIDLEFIFNEYSQAFPKFFHKSLKKGFNSGLNDSLAIKKKCSRKLFWQEVTAGLQVFFIFLYFIICLVGVSYSNNLYKNQPAIIKEKTTN